MKIFNRRPGLAILILVMASEQARAGPLEGSQESPRPPSILREFNSELMQARKSARAGPALPEDERAFRLDLHRRFYIALDGLAARGAKALSPEQAIEERDLLQCRKNFFRDQAKAPPVDAEELLGNHFNHIRICMAALELNRQAWAGYGMEQPFSFEEKVGLTPVSLLEGGLTFALIAGIAWIAWQLIGSAGHGPPGRRRRLQRPQH